MSLRLPAEHFISRGVRLGAAWLATGSVEHRIAAMTPEERARDAIELVERVRARLAALRTIEHELEG